MDTPSTVCCTYRLDRGSGSSPAPTPDLVAGGFLYRGRLCSGIWPLDARCVCLADASVQESTDAATCRWVAGIPSFYAGLAEIHIVSFGEWARSGVSLSLG